MPLLRPSRSRKSHRDAVSANVRLLVGEGRPVKQAVAIALATDRASVRPVITHQTIGKGWKVNLLVTRPPSRVSPGGETFRVEWLKRGHAKAWRVEITRDEKVAARAFKRFVKAAQKASGAT